MRRSLRRLPPFVLVLVGLGFVAIARAAERPALYHTPPPQARPGEPLVVEGLLVHGQRIDRLLLRYRGQATSYQTVEMEPLQYKDLYRGIIPGEKVAAPGVEYFVEGITLSGNKVPMFMSEARPARVLVVPGARPPRPKAPAPPVEEAVESPAPPVREEARPRQEPRPRQEARLQAEAKPPPRPAPAPSPETEVEAPERPAPEPAPEAATRREAERPKAPASEMDEELSLYRAEDRSALAPRHEEKVAKDSEVVVTVNREQMQAMGARSVYDVLSLMPGLSISRDVAGFYRIAVRGLRSDPEVLFLLNGHVLNNFYDGKPLANLPVENLERIEVILGPGPVMYEPGAFLAVVNLVTRTGEGLDAAVSGGSFTTFDGHVVGAKSLGSGFKLFGDADVLGQQGDSLKVDKDSLAQATLLQGYREDPLDPVGYTRDNRLLFNVGAGVSFESAEAGRLVFATRYLREERSALIGLFDTLGSDSWLSWQEVAGDLSYEHSLGSKSTLRIRASFDDQYTVRNFQLSPGQVAAAGDLNAIPGFSTAPNPASSEPDQIFPEGLRERFVVGARTLALDMGADIALAESNHLAVGAMAREQLLYDYSHQTNSHVSLVDGTLRRNANGQFLTPASIAATLPAELASRLTLGLYAQDRWSLLPNLTLLFGIRANAIQLPTVVNGQLQGTSLVPSFEPRVGVAYEVSPALVFKARYARATRPPTVQELFEGVPDGDIYRGRFSGNLNLQSPTMDDWELGADLVQVSGEAKVRLRGNLFYESFTNLIAAVDTTGYITPLSNRLWAHVLGAEGEARLEVSRRTNAWLNASFFRAEDTQAPLGFRLLTDTPQARLNVGISMPLGDLLDFDVIVEAGAERRNNSRSALEVLRRFQLPAYNVVSAQLRTETIADRFSFALVCKNLFETNLADDPYRPDRMPGGVPRGGVSAFLTARASL